MLSHETVQALHFLYRVTTAVKAVPYGFDPGCHPVLKVYPLEGWRARWPAWLNFVVDELASVLSMVALAHFILINYRELQSIIPAMMHFGGVSLIWSLKYCAYFFEPEIIDAANKVFQTSELYSGKLYPNEPRPPEDKLLEMSSKGLMLLTVPIPVGLFFLELVDPMNLYAFYAGSNSNLVGIIVFSAFAMLLMLHKIVMLNFMTTTLFSTGVIYQCWLRKLLTRVNNDEVDVAPIYKELNAIRVQLALCAAAFCPLILTLYLFGCSVLCIVGTSMLILFSDQLHPIIMVIMAFVIFLVVFGFMFGLQMEIGVVLLSEKLIKALAEKLKTKRKRDTKYFRKLHKSQRCLQLHFSGLFDVKSILILQTFSTMAEQIGALVIGFKEF